MSFPALPAPALSDPPNVPADLGKVAIAAENQAVAQYAGYNTTNSPSATSIEARTTAIDSAAGSVAPVEANSAALASNVYTWTGSTTSNLATQSARTAAFPARQTGHDTLINTLNGQLATYEPQITGLINTRAAGLLDSVGTVYNLPVSYDATFVATYTFTPRAGSIYYRTSFAGCFNFTGTSDRQNLTLYWIVAQGTTPHSSGDLFGITEFFGANNYPYIPVACNGVVPIPGDGTQYTFALCSIMDGIGATAAGTFIALSTLTVEDLGAHF
jgi:hypothetical protein